MAKNNDPGGTEARFQKQCREYLDNFWKSLTSAGQDEGVKKHYNHHSHPIAHYSTTQDQGRIDLTSLCDIENQRASGPIAIVIKNIDAEWIAALGVAWDIDSSFFATHVVNPGDADLWRSVMDPSQRHARRASQRTYNLPRPSASNAGKGGFVGDEGWQSWHVSGVLHRPVQADDARNSVKMSNAFARRLDLSPVYGWQSNTVISCAFTKSCYLLLVDTLPVFADKTCLPNTTRLRVPASKSRAGLMIPQLFDRPDINLAESLCRFFTHDWHFDVVFTDPARKNQSISSETFLYLVVASTWASNQRHLKSQIKRIAFEDIRRPNMQITDSLHDCRQNLDDLRERVAYAKSWIPTIVDEELRKVGADMEPDAHIRLPGTLLQSTAGKAEETEKFLMDTYQLLMSSISVLDSQTSIDQARRAQTLTQLALIYVPFSFVTSIFGMNVKEINGSSLSVWVCVPVLVVTFVLTAILFKLYALGTKLAKGDRWHRNQTIRNARDK